MKRALGLALASMLAMSTTHAQDVESLRHSEGYEGRIGLVAKMDEPNLGYCLDVPGSARNILLHIPVWVHSCHSTPLADQVFQYNLDSKGHIRWVNEAMDYDLCLTANSAQADTRFTYKECTDGEAQNFDVSETGQFILRGTDLCIVATNMTEGGSPDEIGEAKIFFGDDYIRRLDLQPCGTRPSELERFTAVMGE